MARQRSREHYCVRLWRMSGIKDVQIDPHTLDRAAERGTDEGEIRDVLAAGVPVPARHGRLGKAKVYRFGKERGGKNYPEKRVEVYYVEQAERIVTVTVYVFYGRWEQGS
jgi:hypothetical protein